MNHALPVVLTLVLVAAAHAQTIPNGTYTFLWGGVDTSATQIATRGPLPALLPAIGRLASGTLVVTAGNPQAFTITWTVSPVNASDTTKRTTGTIGGGAGNLIALNSASPVTVTGYIYKKAGAYCLLPGKSVRIALSPPR
jgi:hypothetical protein